MADLFRPVSGRNQNPADFQFAEIAVVHHRSFSPENQPRNIAGDEPVTSKIWPQLEQLLLVVRERAIHSYSDVGLHPDAEIAVSSSRAWYDLETPMLK